MRRAVFLVVFLSIFSYAFGGKEPIEEEDDVLVLTESNFDQAIAEHDPLLVEFYAPWCGHCKQLAPEYAAAAKALKELDPPLFLAKVDATAHEKLASKYGIQGFPTLKFFRNGDSDPGAVKDYDGGRTEKEIKKWVEKNSGPIVQIITTAEQLTTLKEAEEVVVYATLDSVEGESRSLLEKVASSTDHATFVATTDVKLVSEASKANVLILYKKFDEGKVVYDGPWKAEDMSKWVKEHSRPLVITFSQEKAPLIFGGEIDEHVLVFAHTEKDHFGQLETALKEPAKTYRHRLLHVLMPHTENRVLEYFQITEAELPVVMIVNMGGGQGMKKYAFHYKGNDLVAKINEGFVKDLLSFQEQYFSGEITPTLKSAEPEDDSDEAVKVIVGTTFKERVIENEKDVLLEFYAPWCGHCKQLAPKYEELGEKFSEVESVIIAKMDAEANEIDYPGVAVKGFPTLYFFPGKDKANPILYEGAREVEDLKKFIQEHAQSFELDGEKHGKEDVRDHEEL